MLAALPVTPRTSSLPHSEKVNVPDPSGRTVIDDEPPITERKMLYVGCWAPPAPTPTEIVPVSAPLPAPAYSPGPWYPATVAEKYRL